jgi:hypothetical protein
LFSTFSAKNGRIINKKNLLETESRLLLCVNANPESPVAQFEYFNEGALYVGFVLKANSMYIFYVNYECHLH